MYLLAKVKPTKCRHRGLDFQGCGWLGYRDASSVYSLQASCFHENFPRSWPRDLAGDRDH